MSQDSSDRPKEREIQKQGVDLAKGFSRWFFRHFPFQYKRGYQWMLLSYIVMGDSDRFTLDELRSRFKLDVNLNKAYPRQTLLLRNLQKFDLVRLYDEHSRLIPVIDDDDEQDDEGAHELLGADVTVERTDALYARMLGYLNDMHLDLTGKPFDRDRRFAFKVFQRLYRFQMDRVNKSWRDMIGALKEIATDPEFEAGAVNSAQHWLVLHTMWHEYIVHGGPKPISESTLNHLIHHDLSFLTRTELHGCLKHFCANGLFAKTRRGKHSMYAICPHVVPVLEAYNVSLLALHAELMNNISSQWLVGADFGLLP